MKASSACRQTVAPETSRVEDEETMSTATTTARLAAKTWMVWFEGATEVFGPVSAGQIATGLRAGDVPADASVQRQGDVFWSGILDEPAVVAALKAVS